MTELPTTGAAPQTAARSDPRLLPEFHRYGRFDAGGCYQCGTCTLVCDQGERFPRRVLRCALLGLREPLSASLDPWLCHDCGTCSVSCPRQADPQSSMQTLRRWLIGRYDWTGLAALFMRSKAAYLAALALVAALSVALVAVYHLLVIMGLSLSWEDLGEFFGASKRPGHVFSRGAPTMMYWVGGAAAAGALLVAGNAVHMWWLAVGRDPAPIGLRHYLAEARTCLVESITQQRMKKCPDKGRRTRHWLLAAAVCAKLVIIVFFLRWFQTSELYPITHPQRWVGYLVAALMLYGTLDVLVGRVRGKREIYRHSEAQDYVFPALVLLIALSGLAVHALRYAGLAHASHYAFMAHFGLGIALLVVELPFGRWSHAIYRPLAIYLQAVKERAAAQAAQGAPAPGEAGEAVSHG